jgi:HlyD family secretion protein
MQIAKPQTRTSREDAQRLVRAFWWVLGVALLPLGAWVAFAPLSMAVVAPAFVKVDLNRRPVQHLEGGIVREVLVRDGQRVKAGDPVLILGDVGVDADRNRLRFRVLTEQAALARAQAEQVFAEAIAFPAEVLSAAKEDVRVAEALEKERTLFKARRGSLASEVTLMKAQRERVEQEISALRAQVAQAQSSLVLQGKFYDANRGLLKDGFISTTRLDQIEATVADYSAKLEEQRSSLARAEQRLVDSDLRIKSIENQYMQTASDQAKATGARLSEIEQELRKSEDAALRQIVVAPASGEVIDLRVTSPGAVVRPGDAVAEIVPSDVGLMIEARIRPEDISHVSLEQRAQVKFTAFRYRSTAMVTGRVSYVSGDRLVDRASNLPYYSVMIVADADAQRTVAELKVQAGMPAEVYIEGTKQTPLQYLVEPITSTIRRAGREI